MGYLPPAPPRLRVDAEFDPVARPIVREPYRYRRAIPQLYLLLNENASPCLFCGHIAPFITMTPVGEDHAGPGAHIPVVVEAGDPHHLNFRSIPLEGRMARELGERTFNLTESCRQMRAGAAGERPWPDLGPSHAGIPPADQPEWEELAWPEPFLPDDGPPDGPKGPIPGRPGRGLLT